MRLRRPRSGEIVAVIAAVALAVLTFLPWYHAPNGNLTAWDEFGVADVLIVLAVLGGLTLFVATITERSTALPVASAVWTTLLAFIATLAVLVVVLDKPDHATALRPASWLALIASAAILAGAWQSMRDERTDCYPRPEPPPRPAPPP